MQNMEKWQQLMFVDEATYTHSIPVVNRHIPVISHSNAYSRLIRSPEDHLYLFGTLLWTLIVWLLCTGPASIFIIIAAMIFPLFLTRSILLFFFFLSSFRFSLLFSFLLSFFLFGSDSVFSILVVLHNP